MEREPKIGELYYHGGDPKLENIYVKVGEMWEGNATSWKAKTLIGDWYGCTARDSSWTILDIKLIGILYGI